jgi:hypothetical protein
MFATLLRIIKIEKISMQDENDQKQERSDYYVYAIFDPRIEFDSVIGEVKPIYIGKGCGNRLLTHIKEATGVYKQKTRSNLKYEMINDIIANGYEPIVRKISENMNEQDAYELEIVYIELFGRKDIEPNGILANRVIDQKSLGGGKKGMKHKKKRTVHSKGNTGKKASPELKLKFSLQRQGRTLSDEQKAQRALLMEGKNQQSALVWDLISPEGMAYQCRGLRKWCKDKQINYYDVYHSRNGWKSLKHGNGKGGGRKKKVME